jgi:hypothetical protein
MYSASSHGACVDGYEYVLGTYVHTRVDDYTHTCLDNDMSKRVFFCVMYTQVSIHQVRGFCWRIRTYMRLYECAGE